MQTQKKAFSLVEIIIGLIIISVALAAFAPVVTKRSKKSATSFSNRMTDKCSVWFNNAGLKCTLCYGGQKPKCINCEGGCPSGQALNVEKCKCYSCTSGPYKLHCPIGTTLNSASCQCE